MSRRITRRDFLNGVALGVTGALALPGIARGWDGQGPAPYPPALTGLRGSHDGAFEVAHRLREGNFWETAGEPRATGETYDLVVVGAGISGLTAAREFRKARRKARILVLDNHDDFGGHARRNEFTVGGRGLIGYGGTYAIESAAPYSRVARGLIAELGIEVSRWPQFFDARLYASRGMRRGFFFDSETYGRDALLPEPAFGDTEGVQDAAPGADPWPDFVARAPFSSAAAAALLRLVKDPGDPLPGLSAAEKKARLARMSYADFLTGLCGAPADLLPYFQARAHTLFGLGIDAVPAQDAWGLQLPGFAGMGLGEEAGPGMNLDARPGDEKEPYFFHYPDGNASIARLLLRSLVPAAAPGHDAKDVVLARADYGKLDVPGARGRVRLSSTVVRVRHLGTPERARELEVAYVREGRLESVKAKAVVLACWHSAIPFLCPELPEKQRRALASATKVPIVYTNVALLGWSAFQRLGVHSVHAPAGYHTSFNLGLPVSIGGYQASRSPEEPIVVHMVRTPCSPGLPAREQHRYGRVGLLSTSFEDFERSIREQLARVLGPGGFDPARDIAAITVNRWPHGYAYQYNSLQDPFWLEGGETPCEVARRRFGRIAIANADAGAYAYTDGAIDHGHRAAHELLA
jgi:spermidine dehydrogenase